MKKNNLVNAQKKQFVSNVIKITERNSQFQTVLKKK